MKNFIKNNLPCVFLVLFFLMVIVGVLNTVFHADSVVREQTKITREQFGGNVPMRIYQIYDKDTGVYYAVTETGGITPLYNLDGSLKLVDNGDPGQGVIYKEMSQHMPHIITKPTIVICGSRSIKSLNISRYIRSSSIGCVISGGAIGIDTIAEKWAKANKIEFLAYLPNWKLYGKAAGLVRNKEMVDACDIVFAFWDGKSKGTLDTLKYAQSIGRKYIVHLIEDLD